MIIDTTNYKVDYEKALLTDALGNTTLKTKATLLAFSSILLVVSVYGLQVKQIPGLGVDISAISPHLLIGVLALSTAYLLVRFVLCFLQDYLRWQLSKAIASVAHSGKVLQELQGQMQVITKCLDTLEPHINEDFSSKMELLLKKLNDRASEVQGVGRWHNVLSVLQIFRFWIIELAVPVLVSLIALWLSGHAAFVLLTEVFRAV